MLRRTGLAFFLLFVFSSTFSIGLSQLSLGICMLLTVTATVRERFNPFTGELRWFWMSVAGYVGWLVLVCLLQEDPLRSLDHIREEWLFAIVPVGIYWMRDRRNLDRVSAALAAGVILVGVAGLLLLAAGMEYSWSSGFTDAGDRPMSFHGNFTHSLTFGNYMAVASLLLLGYGLLSKPGRRGLTFLVLSGGVVGITCVLVAGSRGPILATWVGLLALALFSARPVRWAGIAGMIVVVAAVVLSPGLRDRFGARLVSEIDSEDPRSRTFIWKNSLKVVADRPLTGIGPGNFGSAYRQLLAPDASPIRYYTHAHNDFLQVAARSGTLGAVLFLCLWIAVLRLLWLGHRLVAENPRQRGIPAAAIAASLTFLVASLSEATFADEEVRAVIMLVWAVGLSVWYKSETGSDLDEVEPIT